MMRITVSEARTRLGELFGIAQDPRQPIVLTRHGTEIAAIVSMKEVQRIWALQEREWFGLRWPWSRSRSVVTPMDLVPGPNGALVTAREAAQQVHDLQMNRAEERRVLASGGLDPVPGGELAEAHWPGWARWIRARVKRPL